MVEPADVPRELERHWACHGARMVRRGNYRGNDYWIGLGRHRDASQGMLEPGDEWMLQGYYVAVWGVQKGRAIIGFPIYFELNHNPELTFKDQREARIKEAEACAKENIDVMIHAGLLSEYKTGILTPGVIH